MSSRTDATVSVIIPVYRDSAALAQLLQQLAALRSDVLEIIVVDGAADDTPHANSNNSARFTAATAIDSNDACSALCARWGARRLAATDCRGAQLRAGGLAARGAILWFLHADAQLPAAALPAIRSALMDPAAVGGYFRFALQGHATLGTRLFTTLVNWRTLCGTAYGDQGIFVRAALYRQLDGHRPIPLFEEVRLLERLRTAGRIRRLALAMPVDPRRYRRDGWLRRSFYNRLLAIGYSIGIDPFRLASWYRSSQTTTQRDSSCTTR